MNNDHTMLPDAIRVEYLRGYRDALTHVYFKGALEIQLDEVIDSTSREIAEIEGRIK